MNDTLHVAPEVRTALDAGRAVVALESTIITHGMPHPRNLETARAVEAAVRKEGAVPATIAVVDGRPHVGLSDDQLNDLSQDSDVMKLSRGDLAFAVAMGRTGSTTVAATMILAAAAGVGVFATGGIGGVHRGAEQDFDISADLQELARTPVLVVCAGAKAILDVPKTLEVLETLGVPVIGHGTDVMPAFWSRSSAHPVPLRLDDAASIARHERARRALGLTGGTLVANPVPEADEIHAEELETVIAASVEEARVGGVAGKAVTPWLLNRVLERTGGKSLKTNIALVKHNARLAARIATAMTQSG